VSEIIFYKTQSTRRTQRIIFQSDLSVHCDLCVEISIHDRLRVFKVSDLIFLNKHKAHEEHKELSFKVTLVIFVLKYSFTTD
jgi:hypothetical protein